VSFSFWRCQRRLDRRYIAGLPAYEIRSIEHPPRWRDNGELMPGE